jgi:TorA maturation chaperone TorD
MSSTELLERQVETLLHRATVFRVLALGFADPSPGHRQAVVEELARLTEAGKHDHGGEPAWLNCLTEARRAWLGADAVLAAGEYDRLFHRQALCPAHETAYGDGRRMGGRPVELADIRGFYEAFGVQPSTSDPELPDHLAAELEFYGVLLIKTAYAWAQGLEPERQVTEAASKAFLEDHLGRWVAAFRAALVEAGAGSPYPETARLVEAVIAEECRRFDASPRPAEGRPITDPLGQDETLGCPMAGACSQKAPPAGPGPAFRRAGLLGDARACLSDGDEPGDVGFSDAAR